MSNTCPKCGADGKSVEQKYATVISYKCGSFQVDDDCFRQHNDCKDREESYNRGRAEAIAELDAWHTGEPEPRDGMQIILKFAGDTLILTYDADEGWDCSCGVFGHTIAEYIKNAAYSTSDSTWQWREVRP